MRLGPEDEDIEVSKAVQACRATYTKALGLEHASTAPLWL
jgi:hypothetical protein